MDLSRLRMLRGNKTMKELAEELDLTESAYSLYENGKRHIPDFIKARIAEYYGCSVGWLFFDEGRAPDWYKLP